jgi:hypothetical protein
MVVRRKYRSGGRVPAEPVPEATPEVRAPEPAMLDEASSALEQAIASVRRAVEVQREHAQRQVQPSVEQVIDGIAGLSDHKRRFLKEHPEFVTDNTQRQLLARNYEQALSEGHTDDTIELNQRVLSGVARDLQAMRQRELASADHQATEREARAAPPPAPRRSMPITPPIMRTEVPSASGQRPSSTRITLSPDEREIAQISYKHLPPEQRELAYAKAKSLMLKYKAAGVIQGDG